MLATAARSSREALAPLERPCPYCCSSIPREAKKCHACAEWVVGTSGGIAAALLRLLALAWAALTVLGALGLWTIGQGIVRWVWMHAVDQAITPHVVNLVLYTVIAAVLLKGLMVSIGLALLARLAPRRPRWWT
ncbi:MAG: hypothetical protein HOQ17_11745 [Gemmatimonadaceae bacterium]|nr:hypothetical protein [Gemmatimonadaceae bacterium]NUO95874.1 hypothetical protein [Gemmatimonadaceae bacterium]NUP71857.1 hypothetical protein [Gemmatimonadaceae bacterium]NUR33126.1 hypothetical protein [Gemmatimonadaceae bacterium]NUS33725.1 hypothetical protein [Gemmatimonadaceae bacterium]